MPLADLNVCAIFSKDGRPLAAGYLRGGDKEIFNIYGSGCGTTINAAEEAIASMNAVITDAINDNVTISTCSFKSILKNFEISLVRGLDYPVYDQCWSVVLDDTSGKSAQAVASRLLDRLSTAKIRPWQKVFANAAVVYQALEQRGVLVGMSLRKPLWSQDTYSGRSKTMSVNIQGVDGDHFLGDPKGSEQDRHICFDWIGADLRVASLLSGDEALCDSFAVSDPYTVLAGLLSDDNAVMSRSDCKRSLLRAVNSFDFEHPVLETIFNGLGRWLRGMRATLQEQSALPSILGRVFQLKKARNNNPLSVINGVFQGSVAHAMQATIKRVWDVYGDRLLVEIHDSLGMVAVPEAVDTTIEDVAAIMSRPFYGLLDDNPFFPVRVSVGEHFRDWKPVRVYRESGVEAIDGQEAENTAGSVAESEEEAGEEQVGSGAAGQAY